MQIGEAIRTIVVEPLEEPVSNSVGDPVLEPLPPDTAADEPEEVCAD